MNSYEAKKGFLTFVTTLVVGTGVFFSVYYAINNLNTRAQNPQNKPEATVPSKNGTQSVFATLVGDDTEVKGVADSKTPTLLAAGVGGLAGGAEATPGAVPTTGSNSINMLIVISSALILVGVAMRMTNTRKLAIKTFEKRVRKDL